MRAERIVRHELLGYLRGQLRRESSADIDAGELVPLAGGIRRELTPLSREVRTLGVGLGADRDELASGHRHGARDETRYTRNEHRGPRRPRRRDAYDETRGRDQAIVRAEHGGTQPADVRGTMT